MPERLTPGVYVEEISSGIKPIQGVGTSTAGFIGETPRGIPDVATFVNGYADFERYFGGHRRGEAGLLAQSVQAFFSAGGRRAFVVRVLPSSAETGASSVVAAREADSLGVTREAIQFEARGKGAWADHIRIYIEAATNFVDEAFKVRVAWSEDGSVRTVETFDNVRMDWEHEDYAVDLINETSKYIRATDRFLAFLDDTDAEEVPVPARRATLSTREAGTGNFELAEDATLVFRWTDGNNSANDSEDDEGTVTFSDAAFAAQGISQTSGEWIVTAAQLAALLTAQLDSSAFAVTNSGSGSTATVSVSPAVATPAVIRLELPATPGDLDGNDLELTLADADGSNPDAQTVALTGITEAQDVADLVEAAFAASTFAPTVTVLGDAVVHIEVAERTDGCAVTIGGAAAALFESTASVAGAAGTVVDSHDAVTLTVSETLQVGVGRILGELGMSARNTGLDENSPRNPVLRPELRDEDDPVLLTGGTDGASSSVVTTADYQGSVTTSGRTGLRAFDTVDINLLIAPGRNDPAFLSTLMSYADSNDVFFIADGPGSVSKQFEASASEVLAFVEGLPSRSKNAAMFYPWIQVPDPVGVGRNPKRFVPPSGHMAGIFARTDRARGVWKSPAGIEATVSGAIDLQDHLVDADQDLLNPVGMNCIRQFNGTGIVTWGSRTLSSDPEWRYVAVRRTALFLKESLQRGMQWAVFEPNDQDLWDRIRVNITAFMMSLFRQGAFQGATPEEAFLVKCDRETNPQDLVDQGIVTAQVAFAPLKPAEFVVIQLSQKTLAG